MLSKKFREDIPKPNSSFSGRIKLVKISRKLEGEVCIYAIKETN